MEFTIDPANICSITVRESRSMYANISEDELTVEQISKILADSDKIIITSTVDHPEFSNLRNRLEELGYILTQRSWWNGDTVVKPFTINGWRFKYGDRFLSADAMRTAIDTAAKMGKKRITW